MTSQTIKSTGDKIRASGHALSLFFVVSYFLCVTFGLLMPYDLRMYEAWAPLLPGFEWLTLSGFILGFVGAYTYGWYIAIVFVPLYSYFEARS